MPSWQAASFEEFFVVLLALLSEPPDVKELRQGTFDGGVVEPQGNEAALLVQRVAEPERACLPPALSSFGGQSNCAQSNPNAFPDMTDCSILHSAFRILHLERSTPPAPP